MPCPHGVHSAAEPDHIGTGSQPPDPSTVCKPDVNNGSGTNSVNNIIVRHRRRSGRSVRYSSTAPATPSGMARRRVPATRKNVLRANNSKREASDQLRQAEGSPSNCPTGAANGTTIASSRTDAIVRRQRIMAAIRYPVCLWQIADLGGRDDYDGVADDVEGA